MKLEDIKNIKDNEERLNKYLALGWHENAKVDRDWLIRHKYIKNKIDGMGFVITDWQAKFSSLDLGEQNIICCGAYYKTKLEALEDIVPDIEDIGISFSDWVSRQSIDIKDDELLARKDCLAHYLKEQEICARLEIYGLDPCELSEYLRI